MHPHLGYSSMFRINFCLKHLSEHVTTWGADSHPKAKASEEANAMPSASRTVRQLFVMATLAN